MVKESGTVEVRFYKKNCAPLPPVYTMERICRWVDGRYRGGGGDEGKMPLEYLYSAMQMEKYSGAASIEVVSFTLCTVPPLSLFVFYRPSLRYLFPFLSFFFFYLFLHFLLFVLAFFFFCSLFSPSLIRCRPWLHVSGS